MSDRSPQRVVVAMSGGVDSSTAAWMLREAGWQVHGLTLRLWKAPGLSEAHIERARGVCAALGIEHHVADLREEFERTIVEPFCGEYLAGRTPNPCVRCNVRIKFPALFRRAEALGAERVATGHYARIVTLPDGRRELRCGRDRAKDQSYVLHRLTQEGLARILFPLGEQTKEETRAMARRFWPFPDLPGESQEVCFLPPRGYGEFLRQRALARGLALPPGRIVDTAGRFRARHGGIYRFTVGQRRGLGFAAGRPMYVVRIEPETNTVVVGERAETYRRRFSVGDVSWCAGEPPAEEFEAEVKVRYTHRAARARVRIEGAIVSVCFAEPQHAVTPGQSAVFYRDETVLGGGVITRVEPDGER